MSEHPIQQTLEAIRRRLFRQTLRYALSASLIVMLTTLLLVSCLDIWCRFSVGIWRYVESAFVCASFIVTYWLLVRPLWLRPISNLDVALRVEQLVPNTRDYLSAALQFLRERDRLNGKEIEGTVPGPSTHDAEQPCRQGSIALQTLAIERATDSLQRLDARELVDQRRTMHVLLLAVGVLLLFFGWFAVDFSRSSLALQRITMPWQELAWPRRHQLSFVELPQHAKRGEPLEIWVENLAGDVPNPLYIDVREVDEKRSSLNEPQRFSARQSERGATLWLDSVQADLEVRAIGGDGETSWKRIRVRDEPFVASIEFEVIAPEYAELPVVRTTQQISGWRDSQLRIRGIVNHPIVAAQWITETDGGAEEIELDVAENGGSFGSANHEIMLHASGTGAIRLIDEFGIDGQSELIPITIFVDQPPRSEVTVGAFQNMLTANAELDLRVVLMDDLEVTAASLELVNGAGKSLTQVDLLAEPTTSSDDSPNRSTGTEDSAPVGYREEVKTTIDLRGRLSPQARDLLTLSIHAVDAFGNQSSSVQTIQVYPDDEFLARLAVIEAEFARAMAMALDAETIANQLVLELVDRLASVGEDFDPSDSLRLQGARLQQDRVMSLLERDTGGTLALLPQLLKSLEGNHLESSPTAIRLRKLDQEVQRLAADALPEIGRRLNLVGVDDLRQSAANQLSEVDILQKEVIESLERLVADLGRWRQARSFADRLLRLRDRQLDLQSRTRLIQSQRMMLNENASRPTSPLQSDEGGTPAAEFRAAEVNGFAEVGERDLLNALMIGQREVSQQVHSIHAEMTTLVRQTDEGSSTEIAGVRKALQLANDQSLLGLVAQATDELQVERFGNAIAHQENVIASLNQIIDLLRRREEFQAQERREQVERLAREIDLILDAQLAIRRELPVGTADVAVQISQRQTTNYNSLSALEPRLSQAGRQELEPETEMTLGNMEEALSIINEWVPATAEEPFKRPTDSEIDVLQEELIKIESQLQSIKLQLESLAVKSRAAEFERALDQLGVQLDRVWQEQRTVRRSTEQILKRPGLPEFEARFERLTAAQEDLVSQTEELLVADDSMPLIGLALKQASREMSRAAVAMRAIESREGCVLPMTRAENLLREILDIVAPANTTSQDNPRQPSDVEAEAESPRTKRSVDLRTVRILQNNLLEQTRDLEQRLQANGPARTQLEFQRLAELASMQRSLVKMIEQLRAEIDGSLRLPESAGGGSSEAVTEQEAGPMIVLPGFGGSRDP